MRWGSPGQPCHRLSNVECGAGGASFRPTQSKAEESQAEESQEERESQAQESSLK